MESIKPLAKGTFTEGVVGGLGGFGALFEIPKRFENPVLVAGTDGVGTKLKLAFDLDYHETIGIDLVAMCANDVLVQGAEPLFFLDYYATGKLSPSIAESVIRGIAEGCKLAGAALIGGETAEMPGMYNSGEYDIAGFCVGAVEKDSIIHGGDIEIGDAIVGLPSSGPHSNGYSLIRKIIENRGIDLNSSFADSTLGHSLLTPTHIYVKPILDLISTIPVKGMAHITGGGIPGNIARILPDVLNATLDRSSWRQPEIFNWIQDNGDIKDEEMLRTFNCGIGMAVIVPKSQVKEALDSLNRHGVKAMQVGEIRARTDLAVHVEG